MRSICLYIFIAIIFSASCKKKTTTQPQNNEVKGNATATIANTINDSLYITFNGHDIATGTLPHIISITLTPNDSLTIPRADLQHAYRYSYSWHSADYQYSNWFMTNSNGELNDPVFDYYADSPNINLVIQGTQRREMRVCLDGDGISSSWVPTGALSVSGVSVWDTLSAKGKSHSFTISKYHTIRHYYSDTANKTVSLNLAFTLPLPQNRIDIKVQQTAENYILTNNLEIVSLARKTDANDTLFYIRTGKDMTGNTIYFPPYYVLGRKSVER